MGILTRLTKSIDRPSVTDGLVLVPIFLVNPKGMGLNASFIGSGYNLYDGLILWSR